MGGEIIPSSRILVMDEDVTEREQLLRQDYHQQTARIHWHELQTYYAGGSVIMVATGLIWWRLRCNWVSTIRPAFRAG